MDSTVVMTLIIFIFGFLAGFALSWFLNKKEHQSSRAIAEELFRENEQLRKADRDTVIEGMKSVFGDLSFQALEKSSSQFLKLADERLKSESQSHSKDLVSKKELIDDELKRMRSELEKVTTVVGELEKDRVKKFGELSQQLLETGKRTTELIQTTNSLREALAGTKSRGQWGERMAEDVLRLAGFIENVNYVKQKALEWTREIPDFTFFLPRNLILNMDVKFPFDNYMRYLECENDSERDAYRNSFIKDVKSRVKEIASRGYIDAEHNTVDFVLLFIPNEQIYAFIHENDSSIIDDSIGKRVILCSPVTLFSVLAVIRAAVDNFTVEQRAGKIISLLEAFRKQWREYVAKFEKMGRTITTLTKDYDALATTRKNQLERPLNKLDDIRAELGNGEAGDVKLLGTDDDE